MFVCRNHNPVLSSFITYHPGLLCDKSITTGVICGAGTANSSGAPEFIPCLSGVRVARSFVFCVMFCKSWPFVNFFFFFFFWLLCCLSFDLRLSIIAFVSSNFTYEMLDYT